MMEKAQTNSHGAELQSTDRFRHLITALTHTGRVVINVQDNVANSKAPVSIRREGAASVLKMMLTCRAAVLLQYTVDSRLESVLSSTFMDLLSSPRLKSNPFVHLISSVQAVCR